MDEKMTTYQKHVKAIESFSLEEVRNEIDSRRVLLEVAHEAKDYMEVRYNDKCLGACALRLSESFL